MLIINDLVEHYRIDYILFWQNFGNFAAFVSQITTFNCHDKKQFTFFFRMNDTYLISVCKLVRHKKVPTEERLRCTTNNIDPSINLLDNQHKFYFVKSTNHEEISILYIDGIRKEQYSYCTRCSTWFNSSGSNLLAHIFHKHPMKEIDIVMPIVDIEFTRFKTLFLYFIRHHIPLYAYNDPILIPALFPNFPGLPSFLNLLHHTSDFLKETIMKEINAAPKIGLVIDGWTDQSQRRFIGISIFYLLKNKIVTRFLSFSNLEEMSHTALAISNEIRKIADQFDFELTKLEVLVSDSASTMKATSTILGVNWVPCFLHLFDLCFNRFWDSFPNNAKDCIRMCNALQKRPKFVDFLMKEREEDNTITQRNLTSFSKTRWISLASSVRSIILLSPEITKFFSENDSDGSTEEDEFFKAAEQEDPYELNSPVSLEHLNSLVDIGGLMNNCELSFTKMKTALLHNPGDFYTELEILFLMIQHTLETMKNPEWIQPIKVFQQSLKERFLDENDQYLKPIMILHVLDLNHRVTRLFEDNLIAELKERIASLILDFEEMDSQNQSDTEENHDEVSISEYDQFARASQNYSSDIDFSGRVIEEVKLFFDWKREHLVHWDRNLQLSWFNLEDGIQQRFPKVFRVFQHFRLYIGTSVSMENTFSISRRILRWDRMKMSIEKVQELMLVTMNQDLAVQYLSPNIAVKFLEKYYHEVEGILAPSIEEISNSNDLEDLLTCFHIPFPRE